MGSADVSFFRYALKVRQACSVAVVNEALPRRLGVEFFLRAAWPRAGREGLRDSLDLGLSGGLGALASFPLRREGVSSVGRLPPGLICDGVLEPGVLEDRLSREERFRTVRDCAGGGGEVR